MKSPFDYLRKHRNVPIIGIRKFLFMRYSKEEKRNIPVCVEATSYDHATMRLLAHYPLLSWRDWDFVEELEPQHDLGRLGETLKYEAPQ